MKKILFFILLLFSCEKRNDSKFEKNIFSEKYENLSINQKKKYLDSIHIQLTQLNDDSTKINSLFDLSNKYYYLKDFKSSIKVSRDIHKTSEILKDSFNIGKSLYYMGDCFMDYQKDSAYYYYKESEKVYRIIKNEDRLAKVHFNKAFLLFYEGNYTDSEIEVIKSLNYLKNTKKILRLYRCYSLQGSNHLELGEYDKALDYFNQASSVLIEMQEQKKDKDAFYDYNITNIIDICNVYDKQGKYSKSIKELKKIIKLKKTADFPNLYHAILGNLAYSLMKNKNYEESKAYFKKAIALTKNDKNNQGYLYKLIDFGEYHLLTKDTIQANQLFNEALTLSKKLKSGKEVLKTLDFLSKVDKKNTLYYKTEYIRINDSIVKKQRENREKFARIEYETDKVTEANKILSNKNLLLLLGLAITIVLFLTVLIIRNKIARRKELLLIQQKEIANEELFNLIKEFQSGLVKAKQQEQNRISKELHDGIVNQIYGIRMILGSLNANTDSASQKKRTDYLKELHKLESEIRTLSHDLNSDFSKYVGEFIFLVEQLVVKNNEIGMTNFEIDISSTIDWNNYTSVIKINIYRILQELFLNVNKYANATACKVAINEIDNQLFVEIIDNGLGFDLNKGIVGIGLKNIKERAKIMNAEFILKSKINQGTSVLMKIKN